MKAANLLMHLNIRRYSLAAMRIIPESLELLISFTPHGHR
jgi:hypothetical protein